MSPFIQKKSKVFFVLFVLYLIFIVLTSLLSPSYKCCQKKEIFALFKSISIKNLYFPDTAANILFYLPLGILLSLILYYNRSKPKIFTIWILFGPMLSFIIELLQTYTCRTPSLIDVIANSIGFLFGYFLIVFTIKLKGPDIIDLIIKDFQPNLNEKARIVGAIRFMYICIFLFLSFIPFDVSVRPSQIYAKLVHQKIILNPLYHFYHWPEHAEEMLLEFLALLPIGLLTALADYFNGNLNPISPIFNCFILTLISELGQIFVLTRTTDIFMLIIAVISGLASWLIVTLLKKEYKSIIRGINRKKTSVLLLLTYMVFICLVSWAPYKFEHDPELVLKKIYTMNKIPFKTYWKYPGISTAFDILKELGLYTVLGILVMHCITSFFNFIKKSKMFIFTVSLCLAFSTFIELTQGACIGRTPDTTDIVLAILGGIIGVLIFKVFSKL